MKIEECIKGKRMDRYEEALERARAGMPLDKVFPELYESDDERIRKEIVDYFSQFKDDGLRGVDITPWIAYLEKQKEQKPAEWSEEDEACSELILRELEQDKEDSTDYSRHFTRLIDWFKNRLKSLRPQPHWKPSEEQMEALKLIVSNKKHYAPVLHEIALDTLYNDLKKL